MKLRLKLCSCFLLLLSTMLFRGTASAQDWKKDLLEMNKAYMGLQSFRMDIEISSYTRKEDVNPVLHYTGKVAYSHENYYSSMMGRTTVSNKRCMLVVDNPQKMILYKKNEGSSMARGGFSLANIDSALIMLGKNITVTYLQNTKKEKRIQISYKSGPLSKTEIAMDPAGNTIREIVYYYNTDKRFGNSLAKVVVNYRNLEINPAIPESFFSENTYIQVKKKDILPRKKYEKYEVLNQGSRS